ncbi:FadR/GntR family transcriptional regulator [Curtobacterium sp. S6]|uniref:FadR/GntR family transcriptional regulator n=1 Tax=Curtobacterium sp. S6 TaxID=1479623 RepID=UPI001F2C74D3|nr:FCD domain-containing protein [Curtobacterium sp. S6]
MHNEYDEHDDERGHMGGERRVPKKRAGATERMHELQQDIMAIILDRGLAPGDPMPTEYELVDELGVGRNTVRESLKVLQSMGIVEVRHGYGMFVGHKNLRALALGLEFHARMSLHREGKEALDVIEVRQALESTLIGPAMDAMTPEDHASLEECVAGMERAAHDGTMSAELDHEFHRLLFGPLANDLLTRLLEVFWSVYDRIRDSVGQSAPVALQNAKMHRDILNAVLAGHKELASQLLGSHFDALRESIRRATS